MSSASVFPLLEITLSDFRCCGFASHFAPLLFIPIVLMIVVWVLKMESPWSTPTQSEIGEAEAALHNPKGGFFLDPPGDRELGDGEPSFDANVDDYMAMAANNNIEGQDFADDLSQRSSSRGATTRGSKPKRSNSKSPEKRASRSPTKKGGRKGKKSNLGPGKNNFWKMQYIAQNTCQSI